MNREKDKHADHTHIQRENNIFMISNILKPILYLLVNNTDPANKTNYQPETEAFCSRQWSGKMYVYITDTNTALQTKRQLFTGEKDKHEQTNSLNVRMQLINQLAWQFKKFTRKVVRFRASLEKLK